MGMFRMMPVFVTTRHTVVFVLQSLCLSTRDSPEVFHSFHTIVKSQRNVNIAESPGFENRLQCTHTLTGTVIHTYVSQQSLTDQVEKYVAQSCFELFHDDANW
jgi:hypothetical protein